MWIYMLCSVFLMLVIYISVRTIMKSLSMCGCCTVALAVTLCPLLHRDFEVWYSRSEWKSTGLLHEGEAPPFWNKLKTSCKSHPWAFHDFPLLHSNAFNKPAAILQIVNEKTFRFTHMMHHHETCNFFMVCSVPASTCSQRKAFHFWMSSSMKRR